MLLLAITCVDLYLMSVSAAIKRVIERQSSNACNKNMRKSNKQNGGTVAHENS